MAVLGRSLGIAWIAALTLAGCTGLGSAPPDSSAVSQPVRSPPTPLTSPTPVATPTSLPFAAAATQPLSAPGGATPAPSAPSSAPLTTPLPSTPTPAPTPTIQTASPTLPVFTVSGVARAQTTGLPVPNVKVLLFSTTPTSSQAPTATTGPDGRYALAVPPGIYDLKFVPDKNTSGLYLGWYGSRDPYAEADRKHITVDRDLTGIDGQLLPGYFVSGRVTEAATGQPVAAGNDIHSIQPGRGNVGGPFESWGFPDRNGQYTMWLPAGTYDIGVVIIARWRSARKTVTITSANVTGVDFALQPRASASPTAAP